MISRRTLLKGAAALGLGAAGLGGYGFVIEPRYRLGVTRYTVTPEAWPAGLHLKLAVIADLHAGEPMMPLERVREIVDLTNGQGADAVLLLGDYAASHHFLTRPVPARDWAEALARLKAPLGVHAVLGNHDWWDDPVAQRRQIGPVVGRIELERAGIAVYENDAVQLAKDGRPFWLAGLGDQIAIRAGRKGGWSRYIGVDDLPGTLARVRGSAPVILMAHEPDIFPKVPRRVALTIAGHTHGGQVRIAGYSPIVPSTYGNRYAYGHIVEDGRHLVVSGGLGCSVLPVRLGVPPEIVMVEVGAPAASPSGPSLSRASG